MLLFSCCCSGGGGGVGGCVGGGGGGACLFCGMFCCCHFCRGHCSCWSAPVFIVLLIMAAITAAVSVTESSVPLLICSCCGRCNIHCVRLFLSKVSTVDWLLLQQVALAPTTLALRPNATTFRPSTTRLNLAFFWLALRTLTFRASIQAKVRTLNV